MLAFLAQRRKAITALATVLLTWSLVAYFPDGAVTRAEWAVLLVGLAGVFGVHSMTNEPIPAAQEPAEKPVAAEAAPDAVEEPVVVPEPPEPPAAAPVNVWPASG